MMDNIMFKNDAHRDFFQQMMDKCGKNDNYHRAFFYLVGIASETRNHVEQLFDFSNDCIKPDALHNPWQTSGTVKICRLAFNLWCGYMRGDACDYTPYELFDCGYVRYMVEGIKLMYPNCL